MFEDKPRLGIMLADPKAVFPTRGSEKASGYDITAISVERGVVKRDDITIEGNHTHVATYTYGTGLKLDIPEGYEVRLHPRSSIYKTGLLLSNSEGIIDEDYKGEIKFVFYAFSPHCKPYQVGNRIGQLVFQKKTEHGIMKVTDVGSSNRGEGGLGSTGS